MATHSGILVWRIPWTEEPGRLHGQRSLASYSPWGCKESGTTLVYTRTHLAASGLSCNMWDLCRATQDLLLRYSTL